MGTEWHSRKRNQTARFLCLYLTTGIRGPIIFLGGLLLLIGSVLEFVLGNTFPCVVFGTIGKFPRPGHIPC